MNLKIYVAHHRPGLSYKNEIYEPIQVGRAVSEFNLPMIGDDDGDNISKLNPWFCELTAQYWVWKNVVNLDYVGFCHYRRYFSATFDKKAYAISLLKWVVLLMAGNVMRPGKHYPLCPADTAYNEGDLVPKLDYFSGFIEDKLNHFDLVVLKPALLSANTIGSLCERYLGNERLEQLSTVLNELHPEYKPAYEKVLRGRKFLMCNMYIMKWSMFDEYMTWLFSILERYHADYGVKCAHDKRVYGYFSEHLSQVYFMHNNTPRYSTYVLKLL